MLRKSFVTQQFARILGRRKKLRIQTFCKPYCNAENTEYYEYSVSANKVGVHAKGFIKIF